MMKVIATKCVFILFTCPNSLLLSPCTIGWRVQPWNYSDPVPHRVYRPHSTLLVGSYDRLEDPADGLFYPHRVSHLVPHDKSESEHVSKQITNRSDQIE
jgi:hypothetical protein